MLDLCRVPVIFCPKLHKLGSLCYNSRLCDAKIELQHIGND